MFKKTKCNRCGNMFDEAFDECPICHAENENLDSNFKHVQMLSIPKQIGLFLTGLAGFEALGYIVSFILVLTGSVPKDKATANMLLNTVVYALLFAILFIIVNKDIKKLFKSFINWKPYAAALCCYGFIFLTNLIYSFILTKTGIRVISNDNQQAIDSTTGHFPITSLIIFGFIGPICEELTYRVGLFSFSKRISKWLAYPVTIVVFALIHFNFSASSITNELINLPYYAFAGLALTYTYDKFGFAGSMTAHILNNVISLIPLCATLGVIL